jgi:nucleotide-binding universal stress UspA family protein
MKLGKIMVPLDGSTLAEAALDTARALARASGGQIVLMRAARARLAPGADPTEAEVRVVEEATAYLDGVKARLLALGQPDVATAVWYGLPAACVVEAAEFYAVDLIVMTTHGRSGLGRLVMGSVAEAVLRSTTVPILVVRDGQAPLELPAGGVAGPAPRPAVA